MRLVATAGSDGGRPANSTRTTSWPRIRAAHNAPTLRAQILPDGAPRPERTSGIEFFSRGSNASVAGAALL